VTVRLASSPTPRSGMNTAGSLPALCQPLSPRLKAMERE
jgi:hypothetical protein